MKRKEKGIDKIFTVVNYFVLSLLFVLVAYPLLYVLSSSFSSASAIIQGKVVFLPVEFTFKGYKAVFAYKSIVSGFLNSFFYMGVGTTLNIILTIMIAYPLSRKDLLGAKIVVGMLVFAMIFNAGLIPNYMLIKELGLMDTRAVMIIPKALNVWNVIITITYFKVSMPESLLEASKIDGCDDFNFIRIVVIPLSKPIIAVIMLFYAVEHWNSFFDAMLYIHNTEYRPLQIVLREILVQNQLSMDMLTSIDPKMLVAKANLAVLLKYSLIIISSLPLILLYPFVQKHFVKGIMVGSIKG